MALAVLLSCAEATTFMLLSPAAAHDSSAAAILLRTTTPAISSTSFSQQLAAALEQYMGQPGNSSNLEIDIQPSSSQNSGASQFLVTVKTVAPAIQSTLQVPVPVIQSAPATLTASAAATLPASSPLLQVTPNASNNTSAGATTPPPPGYENVPFGGSATTVPSLDTELAAINHENGILAQIDPDSLSTAASQAGDPMLGQSIPNTNLKWNDLTQNQQLAYQHATLVGLPQGQTMSQYLANYVGPSAWWNASYSNPGMFGAPPAAGSVNMYNSPYIDANG